MAFQSELGVVESNLVGATLGYGVYVKDNEVNRTVSQTILTQTIELEEIFRLAANRVFFFGAFPDSGQEVTHNYVQEVVSNAIFEDASDNLAGYNQTLEITQYLGLTGPRVFTESSNAVFSTLNDTNSQVFTVVSESTTNTFSFNEHDAPANALKRAYNVANTMLSDAVTGGSVQEVFQNFDWDSTTDASGTEYDRPLSDSVIKQHVGFKIQGSDCPAKEYSPFVGSSGDDSFAAVSEVAPTLGEATLTLTHPRVSPTTTLVLKNPDYGNRDIINWTKIDRRTRGGDHKIFADTKWPKPQTFELTITNLDECNVSIDTVIDFLNTSLGEEIGLLDWENRQWKGIIIVPESEVTPNVTGHSVRIVFEGELV